MKTKLTALLGIAVIGVCLIGSVTAQDKNIRLVRGRKLVLKGEVSDLRDYFFKARGRQTLTVKLIGQHAVFELSALHDFDAVTFSEETRSWSGRLPRADSGVYSVRVISYHKVASYTLEILLR